MEVGTGDCSPIEGNMQRQTTYTVEEVAIKGIKLAREWGQAQAQSSLQAKPGQAQRGKISLPRSTPSHDIQIATTVCSTDAAWDKKSLTAGLAWIMEDSSRLIIAQDALIHHNVISLLAAEALALREAINAAAARNVTHLRIYSDNQTLIRAINDKLFEKEIYGILRDIEASSSLFVELLFFHFNMDENGRADALTKFILKNPTYVMGHQLTG